VTKKRDDPDWDELPLLDDQAERPGQNLPLFEPSLTNGAPSHSSGRKRSTRNDDASSRMVPGDPAREPHGAPAPDEARAGRATERVEPGWVQTSIEAASTTGRPEARSDDEPAGSFGEDTGLRERFDQAEAPDSPGAAPGARQSAPIVERVLAGIADAVVHIAVLASSLVAQSLLGLQPEPRQWPGFAAFLICFSFLYTTVPLAFWGQTPGMAWRGLRARDREDRSLAFGQTALRWLGALVTTALAGLPTLLALAGGRSLADRLSGSVTVAAEAH
jgi:uncharacterized RDD family membrane protein YckC